MGVRHWVRNKKQPTIINHQCIDDIMGERGVILTDWNLSSVPGKVGLANSNRHLNLRPGISLSMGRANTIGGSDIELRHRDNGKSWFFILRTGTKDISADDTSLLLNFGCAKSSLSVLLSTPESLDVISSGSRPGSLVPARITENWRHIPGHRFDSCYLKIGTLFNTTIEIIEPYTKYYKNEMWISKQNV